MTTFTKERIDFIIKLLRTMSDRASDHEEANMLQQLLDRVTELEAERAAVWAAKVKPLVWQPYDDTLDVSYGIDGIVYYPGNAKETAAAEADHAAKVTALLEPDDRVGKLLEAAMPFANVDDNVNFGSRAQSALKAMKAALAEFEGKPE